MKNKTQGVAGGVFWQVGAARGSAHIGKPCLAIVLTKIGEEGRVSMPLDAEQCDALAKALRHQAKRIYGAKIAGGDA